MRITPSFKGIAYVYWYSKIKERAIGSRISVPLLKDVFMREIICNESRGGNRKGIPKRLLFPLINDFQHIFPPNSSFPFLKRINNSLQSNYEILRSNCDNCLKEFPYN